MSIRMLAYVYMHRFIYIGQYYVKLHYFSASKMDTFLTIFFMLAMVTAVKSQVRIT